MSATPDPDRPGGHPMERLACLAGNAPALSVDRSAVGRPRISVDGLSRGDSRLLRAVRITTLLQHVIRKGDNGFEITTDGGSGSLGDGGHRSQYADPRAHHQYSSRIEHRVLPQSCSLPEPPRATWLASWAISEPAKCRSLSGLASPCRKLVRRKLHVPAAGSVAQYR